MIEIGGCRDAPCSVKLMFPRSTLRPYFNFCGERSTMQRYKIENRKSSFMGYIFQENTIEKSILQNIKTSKRNREDECFFIYWRLFHYWHFLSVFREFFVYSQFTAV